MKVSVIVTTYNRPDALIKVVEGLLAQTCSPHEIIIADDGSDEKTAAVLAPYSGRQNPGIVHVWQEDKGFRAARSRNRAVKASRGDYLILLDGDCIPHPCFIEDHLALAKPGYFFQGKRVLVNEKAADGFSYREAGSWLRLMGLALKSGLSNRHHIIRLPFFPSHSVTKLSGVRSCNMGIFKTDVKAVNGFNHEFIGWGREDTEFVIRLFRLGLKRRENPFRAICFHLWHRENPRDQLERNDALLEKISKGDGFYCEKGLDSLE